MLDNADAVTPEAGDEARSDEARSDEAPAAVAPAPRTWKKTAFLVGRVAIIVLIAGFMVYSVVSTWSKIQKVWLDLAWESVALSVLAALAGLVCNTMGWRAAVADVEHRVSVVDSLRINLIGLLGKYVPGTVWAYVLQMEMGRRAGLPRARAFVASLIATGLGLVTALVVGLIALPDLFHAAKADDDNARLVRIVLYVMLILLPIALVCAIPQVLTRIIQLFLRVVRRPALGQRLTWPGVLRVVGWSLLGWLCFGVHLWLLANAQAAPGFGGLVLCIGALAVAMNVGMFVVVSPSGFGAREGVLVAALVPFLANAGGAGAALGIALASRLIFTVADVLGAGLAFVAGRVHERVTASK